MNKRFDKIVFIVSSLSQPRAIRRVESIAKIGYDVVVYGYDRGQYNCNKLSENIEVVKLASLSKGGNYLSKFRQIREDISNVIKKHKHESCLYYSFGFLETCALRSHKVSYAYEISDIVYSWGIMYKFKPIFKHIDRSNVRNSVFTLMTSEGFKKFLNVKDANIIVQPNKVNNALKNIERHVLDLKENKFVFSFVGSIRYETMLLFAEVIGKFFPQHQFHFYGVANVPSTQEKLDYLLANYPNIKFFGQFKNPDDFEKIYSSVDVVVTTYGLTFNERILDPNKLYEGILFCRPIIATKDTFLAEQVERYQCGMTIDSSSEEEIRKAIEGLTYQQLNSYSQKEKEIDKEFAFDNMDNLSNLLQSIMS